MPDVRKNTIPPTAGGEVQPFTDLEGGECFVSLIRQVPVSLATWLGPLRRFVLAHPLGR
jgi:hypothetical protein